MSSCEDKIGGLWCDVGIVSSCVLVAMLCVGFDGGLMVMLCDIGGWLVCLGKGVVLYLTAA